MSDYNLSEPSPADHELSGAAASIGSGDLGELYRRAIAQAGAVPYHRDYATESFAFMGENIVELTGYTAKEMTPQLWHCLVEECIMRGAAAGLSMEEAIRRARSGEIVHWRDESRIRTRSGETRWIADSSVEIFDESGKPLGSIGILQDITEHKYTEKALQDANRRLASWVDELEQRNREITLLNEMVSRLQTCASSDEAYVVIAQSAQFLFPDQSGALYLPSVTGHAMQLVATWGEVQPDQDEFQTDDCWALRGGQIHLVGPPYPEPICKHMNQPLEASYVCVPLAAYGESTGVFHLRDSAQEADPDFVTGAKLTVAKQRLAVTVAGHVALTLANLRLRETLRDQSIRDPLTGLFNRRYMEESLEREMRRAVRNQQPLGIIMLDLDHFKRFNDSYGHEAGDRLLRALGDFLFRNIRGADIACRYGGEEFTVILPEASLEITRLRAEQLRRGFRNVRVGSEEQHFEFVTLSAGVAVYPEHGDAAEVVLRNADKALYRAKAEGRNRVAVADTSRMLN